MKILFLLLAGLVGLAVATGWAGFDLPTLVMLLVALAALIVACLDVIVSAVNTLNSRGVGKLYRLVLILILSILGLFSAPSCIGMVITISELVDQANEPEPTAAVPTPEQTITVPTATVTPLAMPAPPPTPVVPLCAVVTGMWPCIHLVQPGESLSSIAKFRYQLPGDVNPRYVDAICLENIEFLSRQFFEAVHPNERKNWSDNPCNFVLPGNALIIPPPPH